MNIKIVPGYDRKEEIRALFSEYTAALTAKNRAFAGYLALQNYDEELAHLQEKYGMPEGRLYLLLCDGKPAGCIALKKFSSDSCELKRLYVRPEYRGRGLAKRLARKGIEAAGEAGYRHILLDTFPELKEAVNLYQSLGFYEIERYNNNPLDGWIYMKMDLPQD